VTTPTISTAAALAIDGGRPVRSRRFAPWPFFAGDEIRAVAAVLRSGKVNYWTGSEGTQFEKEYAAFCGAGFGVALANGTVALELALCALGVGAGDEVIVPSRSFIASASCAAVRHAVPVFADVDLDSQTLTVETVRAVASPRTRAVIAVHLAGWPCDMDPLVDWAHAQGINVIEDCAQAHGATYKGRPVGGLGDVAAFSFCEDKIISTGGEGGMLVTNDRHLWERAWAYKDHGRSFDAVCNRAPDPGFRWLRESFGTNWRLTEMQSALGRILLHKLPERVAKRRRLAAILDSSFSRNSALRVTLPPPHVGHSYYKYYVFLRPEQLRKDWDQRRIIAAIRAEGIPCFSGTCSEIYLEHAFPADSRPKRRLPVARELGDTSLMFLVHPTLSEEDMDDTARAVQKVLSVATRYFSGKRAVA